jgi:PAS domain S-box-containing protein
VSDKNYLEDELETLIRREPEIWRFIREASLDGVWYWDLENPDQEYMSPEFWRVFGFAPQEKKHLASEWQDLIHPDDLETAKENLARHIAYPDHPYDQVVRYKTKTGDMAWVRCRGIAIRDDTGKAIRLLGAHNDITALKKKERAAQDTSDLLSLIMDTAQSAIVGLNQTGEVTAINSAGRHLLGGISGDTPFPWPESIDFLETASLQPLESSHNPILRSLAGATLKGEVFLMTRVIGSEPRYVRISSAPVTTSDLGLKCVVIFDDVSEHEKNRQQIERTSRLDALGQLTGGIAHDFNNLLATLQYAVQLALTAEAPEKRARYLDTALGSIEHGAELTKRLLAFAKQQPGTSKSQRVDDVLTDFSRLATPLIESNITVEYEQSEPNLWVFCDTAQLNNALLNLLLNARDAILRSGKGNSIKIRVQGVSEVKRDQSGAQDPDSYTAKGLNAEHFADLERSDNAAYRYVEFSVTDNGPGMTQEVKRRAIDPFFTTKDTNSGTGLGLSMVYGFVQQANGELRIHSELDKGTTVRLVLPRGTVFGQREAPVKREPHVRGRGETVLIVEDTTNLRTILADLISSLGYAVLTARSGEEALAFVQRGKKFDVMITDIVMPGDIGGFELARKIRALCGEVPILYMSGYTGYSESDMSDVVAPLLQKPCPPAVLAQAISEALGQED